MTADTALLLSGGVVPFAVGNRDSDDSSLVLYYSTSN